MSKPGAAGQAKRVRRPRAEQVLAPPAPMSTYCEYYQDVIELIGRRWMGAILRVLMNGEPRRFNELLAAIPGLSDRLLTERLRELTEQGIVERVPAPGISPIAVQYRLTESGRDLEAVVRAISAWARLWRGGP